MPVGPLSRPKCAAPNASLPSECGPTLDGTRKIVLADLATVPLLIIDDLGMRKLPHTAAEDLLELIMRRYERASTLLTSNRPVDDWGKLLGDATAELTSNEYGQLCQGAPSYRLCILTSALKRPKLHVIVRNEDRGCWTSSAGVKAKITESTAATLSLDS